jgi:hypothetical protein
MRGDKRMASLQGGGLRGMKKVRCALNLLIKEQERGHRPRDADHSVWPSVGKGRQRARGPRLPFEPGLPLAGSTVPGDREISGISHRKAARPLHGLRGRVRARPEALAGVVRFRERASGFWTASRTQTVFTPLSWLHRWVGEGAQDTQPMALQGLEAEHPPKPRFCRFRISRGRTVERDRGWAGLGQGPRLRGLPPEALPAVLEWDLPIPGRAGARFSFEKTSSEPREGRTPGHGHS